MGKSPLTTALELIKEKMNNIDPFYHEEVIRKELKCSTEEEDGFTTKTRLLNSQFHISDRKAKWIDPYFTISVVEQEITTIFPDNVAQTKLVIADVTLVMHCQFIFSGTIQAHETKVNGKDETHTLGFNTHDDLISVFPFDCICPKTKDLPKEEVMVLVNQSIAEASERLHADGAVKKEIIEYAYELFKLRVIEEINNGKSNK